MITYLQNWKNAHQLEILLCCIVIVLVWTSILKVKIEEKQFKKYAIIMLVVCILTVFYITVFSREQDAVSRYNYKFFWSYRLALKNVGYLEQIILNVLLLVPAGIVGASLLENKKAYLYLGLFMGGGCISALVETLQFTLRCGFSEVDDIISNTLGTVLGVLLWNLSRKLHRKV